MIVADTNLIVYWLCEYPVTEEARKIRSTEPEWVVPPIWRHELANTLVSMVRAEALTAGDALSVMGVAESALQQAEQTVSMRDALSLAVQSDVTAYDAEFIVLARRMGIRCVTEDKKLLLKFPETTVSMREYLNPVSRPEKIKERKAAYGRLKKKTG